MSSFWKFALSAEAAKRAYRKERNNSNRPETTHKCDFCVRDCFSHIGFYSQKQHSNKQTGQPGCTPMTRHDFWDLCNWYDSIWFLISMRLTWLDMIDGGHNQQMWARFRQLCETRTLTLQGYQTNACLPHSPHNTIHNKLLHQVSVLCL